MPVQLISSPLQGFTDYRFRNIQHELFGGIDKYYAPYIRLNGKLEIKNVYKRDLDPKNNRVPILIPQIMTNSAEEFLFVVDYVKSLGYDELNWNLGCPYPMVTKRGMGSGLICQPEKIDKILDQVFTEKDIKVSMKMRMGYEEPTEILDVFPILDKYPIESIAIHARIGKQLYKGGVDLDSFENCLGKSKHPIHYNGDITSFETFQKIQERFPQIDTFLLGRGLISNPEVAWRIKNKTDEPQEDSLIRFKKLHDILFEEYKNQLSGDKHLLMKMLHLWEYFSLSFSDQPKLLKSIKKAKKVEVYDRVIRDVFKS